MPVEEIKSALSKVESFNNIMGISAAPELLRLTFRYTDQVLPLTH